MAGAVIFGGILKLAAGMVGSTQMSNEAGKESQGLDVYANQVEITFGLFDFTMTFNITGNTDSEKTTTQAVVRMSPAHAKSVALLLNSTVRGYEKLIHEIFLPPDLETDLKSRFSEERLTRIQEQNETKDESEE